MVEQLDAMDYTITLSPWLNGAAKAVWTTDHGLPIGVAASMSRAQAIIGPLCLGAAVWEIASTLPFDCLAFASFGRKPFLHTLSSLAFLLSRYASIVDKCLYIAYSYGDHSASCTAMPRAVAGLSATVVCTSTAVLVA